MTTHRVTLDITIDGDDAAEVLGEMLEDSPTVAVFMATTLNAFLEEAFEGSTIEVQAVETERNPQ